MPSYQYSLPVEQWRQILANVSPGDLCNVVLTSRRMNSVASLPELWAGMKVNSRKLRENGLEEFYNINRFKKVKQINLNGSENSRFKCEELERLLKEIPGSPLESADFGGQDLSGVSADLLASAVSHLHIVNLCRTHLTTDQCVALLKASISSAILANVNWEEVNLSKVPAEVLANSTSRLREVSLEEVNLSKVPAEVLANSTCRLREVSLEEVNLSKVPAEILANTTCRLCEVSLCGTNLTTYQCVALLKDSLSSTTLTNVNLDWVDLSEVPAEILANSISRLQRVSLCGTDLTTDQCVGILKASISSPTLTHLNLENVNLSEVPSDLLANSISRLFGLVWF